MDDNQPTRLSLLVRLKDRRDHLAWSEFVEIYSPAVYGHLRRQGLQDADATDVTQDVFRTVSRSIGGFQIDRQLGSFRGWLMSVVRSRLCDFTCRNGRHVSGTGDTGAHRALEEYADEQAEEAAWEKEYQKSLFDWAVRQIHDRFQETTWQAFWQTAVEGRDGIDVAASLGMTPGAVYVARCRVLAQLKKRIREVDN